MGCRLAMVINDCKKWKICKGWNIFAEVDIHSFYTGKKKRKLKNETFKVIIWSQYHSIVVSRKSLHIPKFQLFCYQSSPNTKNLLSPTFVSFSFHGMKSKDLSAASWRKWIQRTSLQTLDPIIQIIYKDTKNHWVKYWTLGSPTCDRLPVWKEAIYHHPLGTACQTIPHPPHRHLSRP